MAHQILARHIRGTEDRASTRCPRERLLDDLPQDILIERHVGPQPLQSCDSVAPLPKLSDPGEPEFGAFILPQTKLATLTPSSQSSSATSVPLSAWRNAYAMRSVANRLPFLIRPRHSGPPRPT